MSHYEQCRRCYNHFSSCSHYDAEDANLCEQFRKPVDNSNMFNSFFTWKGRYGRKQYLISVLIAIALYFVLIFAVAPSLGFLANLTSPAMTLLIYGMIVALIPSYIMIVAGIKRTHDAGLPTIWAWIPVIALWYTHLILVIAGLFCMFYLIKDKGEKGVNEHGSNPVEPYESQLEFDMD